MLAIALIGSGVMADGKAVYQRCASCHLAAGEGIPAVFPPLKDRMRAISQSVEGRAYMIMAVSSGLMGSINIQGTSYMGVMPAQNLSANEVAEVLNYVSFSLVSTASEQVKPFTEQEVQAIRDEYPGANGQSVAMMRKIVNGI